ncbi:MAG: 1-acyl-sn-glycerol-3-phosphate acyltransferase [Bacteroidales bacterium]|nr:1-acyl-sn-glycerol-3-phosphate acyltransferase [Bacteroidales bacterium]
MKRLAFILYQPYKWLVFFPFLIVNTLFFGVMAVIVSTLINQKAGSYIGGVIWSRVNAFLTPMFVKVSGKENINPKQSYVIVSNHQSVYDIFLIYGWLGIDIKWIMKKELRKVPGVGFGSEKVGHIFIDRSNSIKALESINEAKRKLVNGTSVVIFPEGTRSKTGELGAFKRGAFKIAYDVNLPILPITVINTKDILPTNTINILPGCVKMVIHEPIQLNHFNEKEPEHMIEEVRRRIASAIPPQKVVS